MFTFQTRLNTWTCRRSRRLRIYRCLSKQTQPVPSVGAGAWSLINEQLEGWQTFNINFRFFSFKSNWWVLFVCLFPGGHEKHTERTQIVTDFFLIIGLNQPSCFTNFLYLFCTWIQGVRRAACKHLKSSKQSEEDKTSKNFLLQNYRYSTLQEQPMERRVKEETSEQALGPFYTHLIISLFPFLYSLPVPTGRIILKKYSVVVSNHKLFSIPYKD